MPVLPKYITELNCNEFDELAAYIDGSPYRAKQIRKWLYQNLAISFDEMTDLPRELRQRLTGEFGLHSLKMIEQIISADGTVKSLFQCTDGKTLESALMFYEGNGERERRTVCVSTQAGCGIGCPFCATGQQGFDRNLSSGEIIDQVLYFARYLRDETVKRNNNLPGKERISNVVFMGMGEPLANYDNLLKAIKTLNAPECFKLGSRNMTISTSGLVPEIKRLSGEKLQVGLAVSLHAPDNTLRNKLVPINRKYPLEKLIPACEEYSRVTGRRVSFEYILFNQVNDSIAHARALAELIRGLNSHVNLIAANSIGDSAYQPPPLRTILAFENELKRQHINVTLRKSRGQDISAGCGQLRSRYLEKKDKETN